MFSANENIALRQHKRRVTSYIEATIPESALDLGTMVMAMQVSCKSPGCVPLETAIAIIFPRGQAGELIPGLPESAGGGTYKTKILMPMSDVTDDDVKDALPPQFKGGRRTMEGLCLRARDVMLGQIGQIVGEDDTEGRRLMTEYLMGCLRDYSEAGCIAPEVGEPFPSPPSAVPEDGAGSEETDGALPSASSAGTEAVQQQHGIRETGNFVMRRVLDEEEAGGSAAPTAGTTTGSKQGSANKGQPSTAQPVLSAAPSAPTATAQNNAVQSRPSAAPARPPSSGETATDWRRRQNLDAELNALQSSSSSQGIIQRLAEREHAPGVRRPGCPCCDPDNPANVVDSMMIL